MVLSAFLRAFALYLVSWLVWKLFRKFLVRSSLDFLPGPPPSSLLFGNIPELYHSEGWDFHKQILERYGNTIRIRGAFGERLLLTFDPKALHHIFVKDQWIYEPSEGLMDRNNVYFGEGLLSTLGVQHRKQRKMLNPVFSINHMREMIPLFYEVTERLKTVLVKKVQNGPQEMDILHWMTRTALELIGQSGMGYSFDSLVDDNDCHPYSSSLTGGPVGFFANQFAFHIAAKFKLPLLKRLIVDLIPIKRVQDLKEVIDIMYQTSVEIIRAKKEAMRSADPQIAAEMRNKKDIISILMRANATASAEDRLTDSEVIGQVSSLVFAGMDTTSSALSRILQLLATHRHIQDKLRDEIKEAQMNGQLSYDQLVTLPYLDAVCRETLRVFPPVNLAFLRTARKDMILPLSKPVKGVDGRERTEIFVPRGTNVIVSAFGANCSPELWGPDTYEWKPERWLSTVPESVIEAHMPGIYSHLMTFMGGSRACIGFKFSQLEMKVVLSVLLNTFEFSLSEKQIGWTMNGIAGPYVKGADKTRPQLPMVMSLLDKSS
ncbi:cytochrome P450 [Macrolepiota fuliginosa MF-IS2]|uniref:Cytochrome P450 n=1 Tax=Macrolepiota fuliginosa MF-IS2 TaxID=1400762 RepID=A0A9P6C1Q5_9AGAR|nr:cytochrome P450 [Macrolepiota fuliginosa MF-IS2]